MPTFRSRTGIRRILAVVCAACGAAAIAASGLQDPSGFLWIAESDGVLNIATDSGEVRFEIPQTLGTSAVGVNDFNGDLWAYANRRLLGFDRGGKRVVDVETPVPIHGGDPSDLVVDGMSGALWLGIKRELYRYDLRGTLQQTLTLPRNIVAAALDRDGSILWVAQDRQVRLYDSEGALQKTIDLSLTDKIVDLAYDRRLGQMWMALPDRLRRYNAEGTVVFEARGNYLGAIAPDGAGGLWQTRDGALFHYDAAGAGQLSLEPFAGQPDKAIVDLVADPQDASIWVASRKSVAHHAIDGERLAFLHDLGDGVVRKLSRAALYADLDPPEIVIASPVSGALLNNNRPTMTLGYFDLGLGVDPASIRFSVGGQPLTVSCEAAATMASCVPVAPLADGPQILRATVADRAGNVSAPAELRLTIDTLPPEIVLASPAADAVTNQASIAFSGHLNEAGSLMLDGITLVLDGTFAFAVNRTLQEGVNAFELRGIDLAGNVTHRAVTVTLDTASPLVPAAGLVSIGEVVDGRVPVSGAAGSVEPGAVVRITNRRTGQSVTVTAATDGSFQALIDAQAGDELSIVASDRAGNSSDALAANVPAALGLALAEPVDGTALQHDVVLVSGAWKGPLNSVITVNGVPATAVSDGSGVTFYVFVPLQPGWNDIKAVASLQSGASVSSALVRVNRTTAPLAVKVTPTQITPPTSVRFDVTGGFDFNDQIRYDFNGDGRFDYVTGVTTTGSNFAFHTYTTAGIHRPIVQVSRYNYIKRVYEVIYRPVLSVVAIDGARLQQHVDRVLRSVWGGMQSALLAGDVPGALTALSFDSRATYGEVFESLLPQMGNILDDFTDIELMALADDYAEYAVMNVQGEPRVHIIGFVRGADGIWRIDQM